MERNRRGWSLFHIDVRCFRVVHRERRKRGRVDAADLAPAAAHARDMQRLFFSFIRSYYDPHFLAFFFQPGDALQIPRAIVSLLAANVLRTDRWRWTTRFRMLQGLARAQKVARRFGREIVTPLSRAPGDLRGTA
jgi:hypothetical protein